MLSSGPTWPRKMFKLNTSSKRILFGVHQGSYLGPALFNIFINDIPLPTSSLVKLASFVDDTAISFFQKNLFTIQNTLQPFLTTLDTYFKWWGLENSSCVFLLRVTYFSLILIDPKANREQAATYNTFKRNVRKH